MKRPVRCSFICVLTACMCLPLWGCGAPGDPAPGPASAAMTAEPVPEEPGTAGARPREPVLRLPEAPGTAAIDGGVLAVDVSNTGQGYVMAKYSGSAAKASVLITGPDGVTYKYFFAPSEKYSALPLTSGSGSYAVEGYENIEGSSYAVLFKETVDVQLADELLPFLYANMYVDFDGDTKAVAKAAEIVKPAENDLDAVALVYHYVVENVEYDYQKAETVTSGYLPVVDETLETGKGICFDYAALTAAMLRSQGIPTKLEIGYAGKIYHAWISVYTEETGWIDRLIEFTGDAWTRMDPTFASGSDSSSAILQYIGDGENYNLQYSR